MPWPGWLPFQPFEAIVAVVALYGAGLATWEAYLRRSERRPDVEVSAFIGVPYDAPDAVPRFQLIARNRSTSDVHLVGSGLFFPNRFWRYTPWRGPQSTWRVIPWILPAPVPRPTYPYTLLAGKSARDMMALQQVAQDLINRGNRENVRLRGFVVAEAGFMYSSRAVGFNVSHWQLPWSYAPPVDIAPSSPASAPPPAPRPHRRAKRRAARKRRSSRVT
jgi:hypothetical protein